MTIISLMIFLSCITGGTLLVLWVLDLESSRPWFPVLALLLIGFPWIFWLLTCCYTFFKARIRARYRCSRAATLQRSHSQATSKSPTSPVDSPVASTEGKRRVHFGAVVVMDNGDALDQNGHQGGDRESSVASSQESEQPLNLSGLS
ncbi:uncharacterized protein LOC127801591 [Diospyros lotus]|uniref:uncharacterized protein LOC127801591 n=1 Tax=Diospyros lotus TaxID=55363 RepID=UPI002253CC4B|nr:uncharacterized protein LOC127801591 [Diospyros lotus]